MLQNELPRQPANPAPIIDRVGACASALCAIHCLATGLAMGFLAVAGFGFMAHPLVEFGFVGVAVLVGVWAAVHGIRRHHSRIPSAILILGLSMVFSSHFVGHGHEVDHEKSLLATALAVSGGLCLVAFHWSNSKLQHRGCNCPRHQKQDPV